MECSFCRHQCPAGARGCPRCGAPLSAAAPVAVDVGASAVVGSPAAPWRPVREEWRGRDADGGRTVARRSLTPPAQPAAPRGRARASAPSPARPAASPIRTPRERPRASVGASEIARLGQRVAGALLDGLIITFVLLAGQFVTGFTVPNPNTPEALLDYLSAMGVVAASVSVATLIYHAWGNAIGCTLGKRLVGTRVVHYRTHEPLGFGRGLVRALMLFVLGLPSGLGYLSVLGPEHRGWHDLVANSTVVKVPLKPRRPH